MRFSDEELGQAIGATLAEHDHETPDPKLIIDLIDKSTRPRLWIRPVLVAAAVCLVAAGTIIVVSQLDSAAPAASNVHSATITPVTLEGTPAPAPLISASAGTRPRPTAAAPSSPDKGANTTALLTRCGQSPPPSVDTVLPVTADIAVVTPGQLTVKVINRGDHAITISWFPVPYLVGSDGRIVGMPMQQLAGGGTQTIEPGGTWTNEMNDAIPDCKSWDQTPISPRGVPLPAGTYQLNVSLNIDGRELSATPAPVIVSADGTFRAAS